MIHDNLWENGEGQQKEESNYLLQFPFKTWEGGSRYWATSMVHVVGGDWVANRPAEVKGLVCSPLLSRSLSVPQRGAPEMTCFQIQ